MSDLNTKSNTITINGQEYGMRFTINAIDDIQDHFDIPISDLSSVMSDERHSIRNLRYLITVLINEDIDIKNDAGANIPHVNERYIGRYINSSNMSDFIKSVYGCFTDGSPKSEEKDDFIDSEIPNELTEQQTK